MTPDLADPAPIAGASPHAGLIMWGALFAAVLAYEGWALATGRETLTQTVHHGPRWFKVALGVGFGVLIVHLYF